MAILLSQYPLTKLHLYHIDLRCHLYHLLISYVCSELSWDCSVSLVCISLPVPHGFHYWSCGVFSNSLVGLVSYCSFSFLSYFSGFFVYLFFYINFRTPCLVPGGKKNLLVYYWDCIKHINEPRNYWPIHDIECSHPRAWQGLGWGERMSSSCRVLRQVCDG